MPDQDAPLREALRASRHDVVLATHLIDEIGAEDPRVATKEAECHRRGWQHDALDVRAEPCRNWHEASGGQPVQIDREDDDPEQSEEEGRTGEAEHRYRDVQAVEDAVWPPGDGDRRRQAATRRPRPLERRGIYVRLLLSDLPPRIARDHRLLGQSALAARHWLRANFGRARPEHQEHRVAIRDGGIRPLLWLHADPPRRSRRSDAWRGLHHDGSREGPLAVAHLDPACLPQRLIQHDHRRRVEYRHACRRAGPGRADLRHPGNGPAFDLIYQQPRHRDRPGRGDAHRLCDRRRQPARRRALHGARPEDPTWPYRFLRSRLLARPTSVASSALLSTVASDVGRTSSCICPLLASCSWHLPALSDRSSSRSLDQAAVRSSMPTCPHSRPGISWE